MFPAVGRVPRFRCRGLSFALPMLTLRGNGRDIACRWICLFAFAHMRLCRVPDGERPMADVTDCLDCRPGAVRFRADSAGRTCLHAPLQDRRDGRDAGRARRPAGQVARVLVRFWRPLVALGPYRDDSVPFPFRQIPGMRGPDPCQPAARRQCSASRKAGPRQGMCRAVRRKCGRWRDRRVRHP